MNEDDLCMTCGHARRSHTAGPGCLRVVHGDLKCLCEGFTGNIVEQPLFTKVAEAVSNSRAFLEEQCMCGHRRQAHIYLRAQCEQCAESNTSFNCTSFEAVEPGNDAQAVKAAQQSVILEQSGSIFEGFTEAELKRKPGMPVRLSENVVVTPDAITALVGDENDTLVHLYGVETALVVYRPLADVLDALGFEL